MMNPTHPTPARHLSGRVAVVTGAGRGMGRAIALCMAREGAAVVVSSRTESDLQQVVGEARELGSDASFVVADATQRSSARQPVEHAVHRLGRVDILVNNVGGVIGNHSTFAGRDESFEATLVLNLTSAWWSTTAAVPIMRENGFGRVINIGSTESLRANEGAPVGYVAAKYGLAGLTRQMAQDVGDTGITVNCICPGWTNTTMVDFDRIAAAQGRDPADVRAGAARQCSQNCILEPDDIANVACFLASAAGKRITGQMISVDGGYRL